MFCDECENSEAIFHFTEIANNNQSELHLCMRCAKNIDLNSNIQNHTVSLTNMFSFLCDESIIIEESGTVCPNCGLSVAELSWEGRPGCPDCYKYFRSLFNKLFSGNNIKNKYSGKIPVNYIEIMNNQNPALNNNKSDHIYSSSVLEEELKKAVLEERYEDAAVLRDRIKDVKTVE